MPQKIITETTMQRILSEIKATNILMNDLSTGYTIDNWATVQEIVQKGLAPVRFNIGDQLITEWVRTDVDDPGKEYRYKVPWDIVHFKMVKDADGNEHPGMILQWHYATPFTIQFDEAENIPTTDETFQEGYYYYYKENSSSSWIQLDGNVGDPVPQEGTCVKLPYPNAIGIPFAGATMGAGYGRWAHSAVRQWLNSDADKGNWWNSQHVGDKISADANKHDGFMKGFPLDFLNVVKPIQINTFTNQGTDGGYLETTIDRFFLPSVEELYGVPIYEYGEGEAWQYWIDAVGTSKPNNGARPIIYRLNDNIGSDINLRSCPVSKDAPNKVAVIRSSGAIYYPYDATGSACNARWLTPVCAIY